MLRPTTRAGWDLGITREGDVEANDAAFVGDLDVAGIVTPSLVPPVGAVPVEGVRSIVTPPI